jgi:hypothetical protein
MFDIGKSYKFVYKDVIEKDTETMKYGKVIEYNHPLVKIDEKGKPVVLNLACSQFISASPH